MINDNDLPKWMSSSIDISWHCNWRPTLRSCWFNGSAPGVDEERSNPFASWYWTGSDISVASMLRSLPVWLSADVQTFGDAFPRTELWSIQIQDWTNLSNKPRWTNRVHPASVPFFGLRSVDVADTETKHQHSSCPQHLCPCLPTQWRRCLHSWLAAIVSNISAWSFYFIKNNTTSSTQLKCVTYTYVTGSYAADATRSHYSWVSLYR